MARRIQAAGRRPRSLAACAPEPGEWADRGPAISPLFSPFSSRSTGRGPCRNRAACDMLSPLLPCTAPLLTASSLPPPASATPRLSRYQAAPQARQRPRASPPPAALYTTALPSLFLVLHPRRLETRPLHPTRHCLSRLALRVLCVISYPAHFSLVCTTPASLLPSACPLPAMEPDATTSPQSDKSLEPSCSAEQPRRNSHAATEKSRWERLWPVIACGAGL